VADFELGDRIVLADPSFVSSALADAQRAKIPLSHTLEVRSGPWHAFTAGADPEHAEFLLLCHASELGDGELPDFDQAESPGFLVVDADRLLAIDAALRDEPQIQIALEEVDAQDLPVTVADAGVACRVEAPGVYPVFTSRSAARTVVFVSFQRD
jgi:hypothetical protein